MVTLPCPPFFLPFFFNDTATTEIYTLSLHDALPIFPDEKTRFLDRSDESLRNVHVGMWRTIRGFFKSLDGSAKLFFFHFQAFIFVTLSQSARGVLEIRMKRHEIRTLHTAISREMRAI